MFVYKLFVYKQTFAKNWDVSLSNFEYLPKNMLEYISMVVTESWAFMVNNSINIELLKKLYLNIYINFKFYNFKWNGEKLVEKGMAII